jgi:hypothetical protein
MAKHVALARIPAGERGIMFDNALIRVSASSEYRAHQGRIAVMIQNKTSSTLSGVKVVLPSSDTLGIKKQDPADTIGPNGEVKLLLAVECIKPFLDVPSFDVIFKYSGGACTYNLPMPFSIASFLEPIVVEKADYMARWKSLEGENREAQEVFMSAPGRPVSADLMTSIRSTLFPALHLALAPGLDSESTATACCSLRTGTLAQDGASTVSVGAMLRLEADFAQGRYRLTVRAKHPTVAIALKALIKSHLA